MAEVVVAVSISDLIARAKEAPVESSEPVEIVVGSELVRVRFERAKGLDWATECAKNPPRAGVLLDLRYGYNYHAVVLAVAPMTGVQIVDGDTVTWTREEWAEVFALLSGHDVAAIADAIWELNEWGPQQRVVELGKASAGGSEPSFEQPAN